MLSILEYLNGNMNDDDIDYINIFMVLFVNRLMHETKKVQTVFFYKGRYLFVVVTNLTRLTRYHADEFIIFKSLT